MIRDVDVLRADQWARLEEFVPGGRKGKRGRRADNRRFLKALLWMARSGGRWRDLPDHLGDYDTVKRRYLPLDRDERSRRHPCGSGARSRSGMAGVHKFRL
jgi:transposase